MTPAPATESESLEMVRDVVALAIGRAIGGPPDFRAADEALDALAAHLGTTVELVVSTHSQLAHRELAFVEEYALERNALGARIAEAEKELRFYEGLNNYMPLDNEWARFEPPIMTDQGKRARAYFARHGERSET